MTARRTIAALAVALVAAGGGHAGAADAPPRQVEDPCGDASSRVSARDTTQVVEDGAPERDLAGGGVHVADDVLHIAIDTCGAASTATDYLFQIGFEGACVLDVQYVPRKLSQGLLTPEVQVVERCTEPIEDPVRGRIQSNESREVSRTVLPASAAAFDDAGVRITVPIENLPAVTRPRFAEGTVWPTTAAAARDPEVGTFAFAFGTFPHPDAAVVSRYDVGFGGGYVVGEQTTA